jgi:hypothetical protein
MQIMGTNKWSIDAPNDLLVREALKFAEGLKAEGIAQLRDACIAKDENLMWCTWDTDNLDALQMAFDEMNRQSGLVSVLTPVEVMFPE